MNITMLGAGYVGLVSGTCFSEFGFNVCCVDKDQEKILSLNSNIVPIYEPGLESLIQKNKVSGRLTFSDDIDGNIKKADVIFIAVGTPTRRGDGHADLTYVFEAAEQIAKKMDGYTLVVTKSTVPVGTGLEVKEIIKKVNPNADFDVVSNPEFLREGNAIQDFMRPDRVVVGYESEKAKKIISALYKPLYLIETPILFTDLKTAELIKYSANAFLAVKISYINQMADLCEKVGADVHDVAKGIGLDKRIGNKFLHPGPGYGGSCFPKDTLALVKTANDNNSNISIVDTVVQYNAQRKSDMARKILNELGNDFKNKKVSILGLSFKPETDDMREAPSIPLINSLIEAGAEVNAYDPQAIEEAKFYLKGLDVKYFDNKYNALENADALILVTEWKEFRSPDFKRILKLMNTNVFIDGRNQFNYDQMKEQGFNYSQIGVK